MSAQRRWEPLWLCALVLIAIGGAVFWGDRPGKDSLVATVLAKAESSSPPRDDTKQAVAALHETAKGAADQISDLQRQLKLLSEQVGALAARVDSLEKPGNPRDSNAWAPVGSDTLGRFVAQTAEGSRQDGEARLTSAWSPRRAPVNRAAARGARSARLRPAEAAP